MLAIGYNGLVLPDDLVIREGDIMSKVIRIIRPSGSGGDQRLSENIETLREAGFEVRSPEHRVKSLRWPYSDGTVSDRSRELWHALTEQDSQIILCARGGYGASDLLPFLPWELLKSTPQKWLVGFSDITALQSGLFARLSWPSIHGPMPASALWGKNSFEDIERLMALFRSEHKSGWLSVSPLNDLADTSEDLSGVLFGGCFSVLCSLSGTPWFPQNCRGMVLFLEDIGENPGQLMRHLNQLVQNDCLKQVKGLIIGSLSDMDSELSDRAVKEALASRLHIPCWESNDFGHISPNMPLVNGAKCVIGQGSEHLNWTFEIS